MIQAAAIIGIIASMLGLGAATFTLLFGGAASAFGTSSASMVVGLGLGGVLFSFAALVASALVFARPRGAGYALIVIALAGAVLGGTLVAVCMTLVLIAGILAIVGARAKPRRGQGVAPSHPTARTKRTVWLPVVSLLALAGILAVGLMTLNGPGSPSSGASNAVGAPSRANPVAELVAAPASGLSPSGELAATFEIGGAATDVQRENAFRAIEGQVVVWELPVFDVQRRDDGYRVATQGHVMTVFGPSPRIRTRIMITPRDDAERQRIEALTTGQMIHFKGRIKGVTLRQLEIEPAILWAAAEPTPANVPTPATSAAVATVNGSEEEVRHFMAVCQAIARQRAIEFGGMGPDEANRHAADTCGAAISTARRCLAQSGKTATICAGETVLTAE